MSKNKALIKHEIRGVGWMTLYFLSVVVVSLMFMVQNMQRTYTNFLGFNNSEWRYENIFTSMLIYFSLGFIVFMLLGIVLISYIQFIDIKSIKVGRFLKSLPFKNSEVFKVKIGVGILTYTIPFIIFSLGVLIIRQNNLYWINDIYQETAITQLFIRMDSLKYVGAILLLSYLILTVIYLFLVMMQYIVSNKIASIVIGGLTFHATVYILLSCDVIYRGYGGFIEKILEKGGRLAENFSVVWLYSSISKDYYIRNQGGSEIILFPGRDMHMPRPSYDITGIEYLDLKLIVCIVMVLAFGSIAYWCSKCYQVENADILIGFGWARKIFIIGVTVCSVFVLPMIKYIFFDYYFDSSMLLNYIVMALGGIIGYIIAKKIAYIGVRK